MLVDTELLRQQSEKLGRKILTIQKEVYDLAGEEFNLSSTKQLREILFVKKAFPVIKKTPGGEPSTDESVLQQLAEHQPLAIKLLEYRGLSKLKTTYTDKLPKMVERSSSRIHTNYGQAVAITGRLSSSDPNLQNIPIKTIEGRKVREAFIAPENSLLISADYSQIELRIMAHLSGDKRLKSAFERNEDVHRETAAQLYGISPDAVSSEHRRFAKVINFGLIYGMSSFGLAKQLNIEINEAQLFIERYFRQYPGVKNYMDQTRQSALERGFVETVFGRRLYLPNIKKPGLQRKAAEREAINAPMQGTAADLIKIAMIRIQKWISKNGMNMKIIMQVHDELVLEVPDQEVLQAEKIIPSLMTEVEEISVPLTVEIGKGSNWEMAH